MAVHFDPIEILEAYFTKVTAKKDENSPRYQLAQERLKVCNACNLVAKNKIGIYYCSKCGCAIGGKVFSKRENPCPEQKWQECDKTYFNEKAKEAQKSKQLI